MEGMPKQEAVTTAVENEAPAEAWRELEAAAPTQAAELLASLSGFEELSVDEKVDTLTAVIAQLETSNDNRFVAKEIGREIQRIQLRDGIEKGKQHLAALGAAESANDNRPPEEMKKAS